MKRIAILFCATALCADDTQLLTQAVSRLIDDNRQVHQELAMLRMEAESLKRLETQNATCKLTDAQEALLERFAARLDALEQNDRTLHERIAALDRPAPISPDVSPVELQLQAYDARTTAKTLNLRSGPATVYPVLRALTAGAGVRVIGRNAQGWAQVISEDTTGWVYAQWIETIDKEHP